MEQQLTSAIMSSDTANTDAMGDVNPPSYFDAITAQESSQDKLPVFTMDGCIISSRHCPSLTLYELSNPPCKASTKVYGVQKYRYRIVETEEGTAKRKFYVDHIYDFKDAPFSSGLADLVIEGRAHEKRAFKKVLMSQGLNPSSFSVKGHFKTEQGILGCFNKKRDILWKDAERNVVAVEKRLQRDKEGKVEVAPELEMRMTLDERSLDFLVTCWAARLWKESQKELAVPLSWGQSECFVFF